MSIQEYINSRKYLLKMLIDRGYKIPDKELNEKPTKIEGFNLKLKHKANDTICLVFYEVHLKYGKEQLYKTLDIVKKFGKEKDNENKKINVVIVMLYKSGSTLEKYKREYPAGRTGINVELWLASNFQFDVTDNNFVPKHEIYNPSSKDDNIAGIPAIKLPRILISDPQVRYLGARTSEIIKITRTSETAGHTIIYKRVI